MRESERAAVAEAFDHARKTYDRIMGECEGYEAQRSGALGIAMEKQVVTDRALYLSVRLRTRHLQHRTPRDPKLQCAEGERKANQGLCGSRAAGAILAVATLIGQLAPAAATLDTMDG